MIALDTNVLVRYVVRDDPEQTRVATKLIETVLERGESVLITRVVLCELVWVLSRRYRLPKKKIVQVLDWLRRSSQSVLEGRDGIKAAVDSFESGSGDFADYLIAEAASEQGCVAIATFDRVLWEDPRFRDPAVEIG